MKGKVLPKQKKVLTFTYTVNAKVRMHRNIEYVSGDSARKSKSAILGYGRVNSDVRSGKPAVNYYQRLHRERSYVSFQLCKTFGVTFWQLRPVVKNARPYSDRYVCPPASAAP